MAQLGLPAICIDARKAHKSLSARLNKSDRADAEGLAQLARMNWFTPVHIRSEESDRLPRDASATLNIAILNIVGGGQPRIEHVIKATLLKGI